MTNSNSPALSLVLALRNDADSVLNDLCETLTFWLGEARRHGVPIEVLVVDWNSPRERPSLRQVLKECVDGSLVRLFSVPEEVHQSFPQGAALSFVEHLAWNVGIRRARGTNILVTRPGVRPTPELAAFALKGPLVSGVLYRTDVYEVSRPCSGGDEIASCTQRIYRSRETLDLANNTSHRLFHRRFEIYGEPFLELLFRWVNHFLLILSEARAAADGGVRNTWRLLANLGRVWRRDVERVWYLSSLRIKTKLFFKPLHVNAAGDFLLASRESWFALCGVPEYPGASFLVDAMFVMAAAARGKVREHVLPWPMAMVRGRQLSEHNNVTGIEILTPFEAAKQADILSSRGTNVPLNADNWGLGGLELMEWTIGLNGSVA